METELALVLNWSLSSEHPGLRIEICSDSRKSFISWSNAAMENLSYVALPCLHRPKLWLSSWLYHWLSHFTLVCISLLIPIIWTPA